MRFFLFLANFFIVTSAFMVVKPPPLLQQYQEYSQWMNATTASVSSLSQNASVVVHNHTMSDNNNKYTYGWKL